MRETPRGPRARLVVRDTWTTVPLLRRSSTSCPCFARGRRFLHPHRTSGHGGVGPQGWEGPPSRVLVAHTRLAGQGGAAPAPRRLAGIGQEVRRQGFHKGRRTVLPGVGSTGSSMTNDLFAERSFLEVVGEGALRVLERKHRERDLDDCGAPSIVIHSTSAEGCAHLKARPTSCPRSTLSRTPAPDPQGPHGRPPRPPDPGRC